MNNKLGIAIVAHNEETHIRRCLESVLKLKAPIYLVHDGSCSDATLKIASSFTKKIFIKPFVGEAEPHRTWLYKQMKEEWIFQIDADEFINMETIAGINELIAKDDGSIDAFDFVWPYFDGKQYRTKGWPRKRALFRRKAIQFIGSPHEIARVEPGKSMNVNLIIEHKPGYDNYAWKNFAKHQKWINLHARMLLDQSSWKTFGTQQILPVYFNIVRHPRLFAFPLFSYHFVGLLILGGLTQGYIGIRNSFMQALYWLRLCLRIHYVQTASRH